MLGILLYLIIAAIICGVLYMIVGMIPLPGPFNRILAGGAVVLIAFLVAQCLR
jgi:hypothetical protein